MASLNVVTLIGNVGKDPEIRYTTSGVAIANFSLATTEKWNGKDGSQQEKTEWHRVEVFGKMADIVRDYVTKGKQLYIEGQIVYEEWNDKDGNKRNTTKIKLSGYNSKLILLGGGKSGSEPRQERTAPVNRDNGPIDDDEPPF
jgi:single-strand DNA-binding protein